MIKIKIPYVNLERQSLEEKSQLLECVEQIIDSGQFVGGSAIESFEETIAQKFGFKHVIGVSSGTAALILSIKALGIGPGDEVITAPNSYITSTSSIVLAGARPVFADIQDDLNIDPKEVAKAITKNTKAILPIHLSGRIADMGSLKKIANDNGLYIIEDAAQAIGSKYCDQFAGSFGNMACFSAHPLKNLNALGDAGFISTDNEDTAKNIRILRNAGLKDRNTAVKWADVSRMDSLQAAILSMRLKYLDSLIERRRQNAEQYLNQITTKAVQLPIENEWEFNSYHTFVIRTERRGALIDELETHGIGSAIHYPIPIHLNPVAKSLGYGMGSFPKAERYANQILSLPIHQYLSKAEIHLISNTINKFND